jgi:hypothetical protein
MDEITYEVERQSLETPKPEVASNDRMKNLQVYFYIYVLNIFLNCYAESKWSTYVPSQVSSSILYICLVTNGIHAIRWRKEPYRLRKYDRIEEYVPASCLDEKDGADLQFQLVTSLDGYMGPAYNYDDTSLTEEWMMNFKDGGADGPSEDDVIRTQIECVVDIMLGQVQDMVCNDLKVLANEPVGLGPRLKEKPVWGIDCNTNRTIELVLEEAYTHSKSCGGESDSGEAESEPLQYSSALLRRFIERVLLPAINAVPSHFAHRMDIVLQHIIQVHKPPPFSSSLYNRLFCCCVLEQELKSLGRAICGHHPQSGAGNRQRRVLPHPPQGNWHRVHRP